ncbi:amidohydrolase [Pseudobdellovibrio exovorus]|uniref:Metal-dependent hydrolase n=1 Tax=Pseudobdellovibrio exovorus JSS TaxID=1184267 RepID=M4V8R2_9BACT|nr:amidohydrolase family protein [Pseudobdellovibrio exovorus]AGH94845.1 metal-dependent hydrolase [Pseudobdellovibrio exovorus JSS]
MSQIIHNCYDSHTHFWATGQVAEGLKLQSLKNSSDISNLQVLPQHFRAEWLVGFGWDQNQWSNSELPDRSLLDRVFPDYPVFFSRVDGHASWLNSKAIQELTRRGYDFSVDPQGGRIVRTSNSEPTGILFDQAHINALLMLPDFSESQHRSFFLSSQKIFNRAGFTHVRDLSMNTFFWNMLKQMEDSKSLTVFIEGFVTIESVNDVEKEIKCIHEMRSQVAEQIRVQGVKIFIDGSLGSKTAALSQSYRGEGQKGLLIWTSENIKEVLRQTWQAGLQVAIHCIGDEAVHTAVKSAREVAAEGILGRLHLEHVQLLRQDTLQMMKPLHVTCHMQPCHWLSDHTWLKKTLPDELHGSLFQWELLRKNKIPLFFGSDSPIEDSSLLRTRQALLESPKWGIPALQGDWWTYHVHPDRHWGNGQTELGDNGIIQVFLNGESLL